MNHDATDRVLRDALPPERLPSAERLQAIEERLMDEAGSGGALRFPWWRPAVAVAAAIVLAAVVGLRFTGWIDDSPDVVAGDESGEEGMPPEEGDGELEEVEVTPAMVESVERAIAPYDPETSLEEAALYGQVQRLLDDAVAGCVEEEGLPPREVWGALPGDPVEPTWNAPGFPDLDLLLQEGFRPEPATGGSRPPDGVDIDEYLAVEGVCYEDAADAMRNVTEPRDRLMSAWRGVTEEVDQLDEVRDLQMAYVDCLREGGIGEEQLFGDFGQPYDFGITDGMMQAAMAAPNTNEILDGYADLYVGCGRDWIDHREEILQGDRRDQFLQDHADEVEDLAHAYAQAGLLADG